MQSYYKLNIGLLGKIVYCLNLSSNVTLRQIFLPKIAKAYTSACMTSTGWSCYYSGPQLEVLKIAFNDSIVSRLSYSGEHKSHAGLLQ